MKIYSFWSGDTTYITKSKSLQKARKVGRENYKHYLETCKYLEEEPKVGKDYFIPDEVEKEQIEWLNYLVKVDDNIMILDDEIYSCLTD